MPSDDFPKYKSIIETNKFKFIDKPNVKMYKMIEKRCHDNAFILKQLGIIDKIGYGYALSENGCRWREHSWGIKGDTIIETTVGRQVYLQLNVDD